MASEVGVEATSVLDVSSTAGSSSSTGISSKSVVSVAAGSSSSSARTFSLYWIRNTKCKCLLHVSYLIINQV